MIKQISLTQGQFALVDADDFEWLSQWKWCAHRAYGGRFYAVRNERIAGKKRTIPMHRVILGLQVGESREGDHINGNTLDNTRSNLRIASHRENVRNRGKQINNRSGYVGVHWIQRDQRWRAQISVNGKNVHLGNFQTKEQASAAYLKAAREHHGQFVRAA